MKRFIFLLLLVIGVAASWYAWKFHFKPPKNPPLVFHGNIDIREVRLGFRVSGRVSAVLKDEGAQVEAGDVLARMDDEPYRHSLAQAEAQVQSLAARLEELKKGSRPEEIEQARKILAEAVAAQDIAWIHFKRQRDLVKLNAVSRQDFDNAESVLRRTTAQREASKAGLDLLLAGTRSEQIDQAEANLAAAQATRDQAQTQLADTVLTATEAGVVLTRAVEPGTLVQAGSTALTMSLLSPVWARAYVPEPQLGLIHPGREVLVFTDSRPDPYHGQVGDVSPRAEFTPKSVETADLRTSLVYRFRVVIRDADQGLRQGMPITVRLVDAKPQPAGPVNSGQSDRHRSPVKAQGGRLAKSQIMPVVVRLAD